MRTFIVAIFTSVIGGGVPDSPGNDRAPIWGVVSIDIAGSYSSAIKSAGIGAFGAGLFATGGAVSSQRFVRSFSCRAQPTAPSSLTSSSLRYAP